MLLNLDILFITISIAWVRDLADHEGIISDGCEMSFLKIDGLGVFKQDHMIRHAQYDIPVAHLGLTLQTGKTCF